MNNEVVMNFDHRVMGVNLFGLSLVILRSTFGQSVSSESSEHVEGPSSLVTYNLKDISRIVCYNRNKTKLSFYG